MPRKQRICRIIAEEVLRMGRRFASQLAAAAADTQVGNAGDLLAVGPVSASRNISPTIGWQSFPSILSIPYKAPSHESNNPHRDARQ
jgi:hypothetical protein